jgi:HNH endonuclease
MRFNMKIRIRKRSDRTSSARHSGIHKDWIEDVLKRDNYTCRNCGSTEQLCAHHIVEWEDDESLRFVLDNGLTLCSPCHTRHHSPHKGFTQVPWNKGLKTGIGGPKGRQVTEEQKIKIGEANKKWLRTDEYRRKLCDAKTPENIEANKMRQKGRSWRINQETGKREWYDKHMIKES